MEINVSVQGNGGLLPEIILLTRCGYIGEPVWYHEEVLSLQLMFLKPLDIFSLEGGCSEGLDAFILFLNTIGGGLIKKVDTYTVPVLYTVLYTSIL